MAGAAGTVPFPMKDGASAWAAARLSDRNVVSAWARAPIPTRNEAAGARPAIPNAMRVVAGAEQYRFDWGVRPVLR